MLHTRALTAVAESPGRPPARERPQPPAPPAWPPASQHQSRPGARPRAHHPFQPGSSASPQTQLPSAYVTFSPAPAAHQPCAGHQPLAGCREDTGDPLAEARALPWGGPSWQGGDTQLWSSCRVWKISVAGNGEGWKDRSWHINPGSKWLWGLASSTLSFHSHPPSKDPPPEQGAAPSVHPCNCQ